MCDRLMHKDAQKTEQKSGSRIFVEGIALACRDQSKAQPENVPHKYDGSKIQPVFTVAGIPEANALLQLVFSLCVLLFLFSTAKAHT